MLTLDLGVMTCSLPNNPCILEEVGSTTPLPSNPFPNQMRSQGLQGLGAIQSHCQHLRSSPTLPRYARMFPLRLAGMPCVSGSTQHPAPRQVCIPQLLDLFNSSCDSCPDLVSDTFIIDAAIRILMAS